MEKDNSLRKKRKSRPKELAKKHPQKAPKNNYFSNLMKTEEGRRLRKEWSNKPRKNAGRPKGVPDGFTKETIKPIRDKAKKFAEVVVSKIDIKNEYAKEALETAVEILRTPSATRDRLASARLILEFTEAKPASKSEVTLHQAEAWLEELAKEDDKAEINPNTEEIVH